MVCEILSLGGDIMGREVIRERVVVVGVEKLLIFDGL
jgi:hypothetical protein